MISTCQRSRDMKLNRYFDMGTLGGGFRTPKPDPMILCLHAHIVSTISSSHQGYVSTFGPHYSLYQNIPYNFYHSSKLHKFEWFWVYVSPFVFLLKYFFLIFSNDLNQKYVITPTPLAHFDPGPFPESRLGPRTNALQPTTQLDLADPSKWNWYNCISHRIHVWYIC